MFRKKKKKKSIEKVIVLTEKANFKLSFGIFEN